MEKRGLRLIATIGSAALVGFGLNFARAPSTIESQTRTRLADPVPQQNLKDVGGTAGTAALPASPLQPSNVEHARQPRTLQKAGASADTRPSWAWGTEPNDGAALYRAWRQYANTQGNDGGAADELVRFAWSLEPEIRKTLLTAAAGQGDWLVLSQSFYNGMLRLTKDEQAVTRFTFDVIQACPNSTWECSLTKGLWMISPTLTDGLWSRIRKDMGVCGLPRTTLGMKTAVAAFSNGDGQPWCTFTLPPPPAEIAQAVSAA